MGNRRISEDIKLCALRLWASGWLEADICEALQVSRSSLFRWQSLHEEFGRPVNPPSPIRGRSRIIARAIIEEVHRLHASDPDMYLDELQYWLALHHDIAISIPALQRNLTETGLTRKLLLKIASERDQQLRDEWNEQIRNNFSPTGNQLIFIDEASKNDHDTACRYGRSLSGKRAEFVDVFVRGDRYSIAAALSIDGYIATRVVPGSFNSIDFAGFVAEEVVSFLHDLALSSHSFDRFL